jgi:hypothetical protein
MLHGVSKYSLAAYAETPEEFTASSSLGLLIAVAGLCSN